MRYFIQRGTTVKGPFDKAQLKALAQGNKLKKSDGISESADGPWDQFGSVYKQILASAKSRVQPAVPTISAWTVKRGLLGKIQVNFKCPGCHNELKCDESEVLQRDYCSGCGAGFILGKQVADEIAVVRERIAAERVAKDLENQQKKEQRQQRKERERKERERKERERKRKHKEQEQKQEEDDRQHKQFVRKKRHQAELLPPAQPIVVVPSSARQESRAHYQQAPVLYQHGPAPQLVQQTVIVNVGRRKSRLTAFLLAFFFGPLGMLYSTVAGALVMFLVNIILGIPTFFLILLITWPLGCVWAVAACD